MYDDNDMDDQYENQYGVEDEGDDINSSGEKLTVPDILDISSAGGNVASHVDDTTLDVIASKVVEDFKRDQESRSGWTERMDNASKLAMQVAENKTWPWPNAANVKFPLLTVAVMQFASRVYPALVRMPYPISGRINGFKTQDKMDVADRMARHMSWQLTDQMETWCDDQDTLCHVLPIMGCCFKKTYRDPNTNKNVSELVLPDRLVFDYYAKSAESARTVTHWFYQHHQTILEWQRLGLYLDVDLGESGTVATEDFDTRDDVSDTSHPTGKDEPHRILEQHTWYDLDGDGYEEPYIITVDERSRKTLRIVPRYGSDSVIVNADTSEIAKIEADQYFTQYIFIPDPTGGNLGIGWGTILYPINDTINTLINQLVDAGTLGNLGGGLVGKELKMASGDTKRRPGQWVRVNNFGMDIGKSVYPWPQQEPSQVLYMLLTLLIDWGQRITSVSDAMAGETPPANVPATTTLAMLEQGQKVFQGIYQRMFRAFNRELKKLKNLNKLYMDQREYYAVLDETPMDSYSDEELARYMEQGMTPPEAGIAYKWDYERDDADVTLTAEQTLPSDQIAMMRIQLLMQAAQSGVQINPRYAEKLWLTALGLPESEAGNVLAPPPPPQPDPKVQTKEMELQYRTQADQERNAVEMARIQTENKRIDLDARLKHAKDRASEAVKMREGDIKEMDVLSKMRASESDTDEI